MIKKLLDIKNWVALYIQILPERVVEPKLANLSNSFMPSPSLVKRYLDYTSGEYIDSGIVVAHWNGEWESLETPGIIALEDRFDRTAALLLTLLTDQVVYWSKDGVENPVLVLWD